MLLALSIFYIQEKQWDKALPFAEKLVELMPKAPGPKQMVKQVKQAIEAEKESDE
jgi:hypothetical protein